VEFFEDIAHIGRCDIQQVEERFGLRKSRIIECEERPYGIAQQALPLGFIVGYHQEFPGSAGRFFLSRFTERAGLNENQKGDHAGESPEIAETTGVTHTDQLDL
jgi:hypothetical protein